MLSLYPPPALLVPEVKDLDKYLFVVADYLVWGSGGAHSPLLACSFLACSIAHDSQRPAHTQLYYHTHRHIGTDFLCAWGMQMRLNWKSEAFTAWNRTSLGR